MKRMREKSETRSCEAARQSEANERKLETKTSSDLVRIVVVPGERRKQISFISRSVSSAQNEVQ